jgi:hypothetical protein
MTLFLEFVQIKIAECLTALQIADFGMCPLGLKGRK